MLLSFIIPLYNCERYISRCLDGILLSELPADSYEIIIVNDGSIDKGPNLCQEYVEKYPHIQLLNQENTGQATARNHGLLHAQGDYIWFVDADDAIMPKIVPLLYREISNDNSWDLISFNYQIAYTGNTQHVAITNQRKIFEKGIDYLNNTGHRSYLWHNIYRRASIKHLFVENTSHIEDMCFNVQNILNFKRILLLDSEGYIYNQTNVSSTSHTHNENANDKANQDAYRIYSTLHQTMCNEYDIEKQKYLRKTLNFGITGHIYTMAKESNYRIIKQYIQKYKQLGLYPIKRSDNIKANMFIPIANNKLLLYIYCKLKSHK